MEEKLRKEIKILKKKLERSEANRRNLEAMRDRNSKLFETYTEEIEQQRKLIKDKKEQLEGLTVKLAKYLSPQIFNSIFTGEREVKIETYRKTLTIFFSNIVGFTEKSDSLSPEELSQWLNRYLDQMANIAQRFGGTLDKFIGDAVMIFFGDPKSEGVKEDAIKCLSMAMAMRQEAKNMDVDIRMGINTGECTVGNFGSSNRMEYTVIGGAVNLAARLEANSRKGQILISEATHELTKDSIYTEEAGIIKIKGLSRDVQSYWVTEDFFKNRF